MLQPRLFRTTAWMLVAVIVGLTTIGQAAHMATCSCDSQAVAVRQDAPQVNHGHASCCHSHHHDHSSPESPVESPDSEKPHDSSDCPVCHYLSMAAESTVVTECPGILCDVEGCRLESESPAFQLVRWLQPPRGPPVA